MNIINIIDKGGLVNGQRRPFSARLKSDAKVKHLYKRRGRKTTGVITDQAVMPSNISDPLRLVCCLYPETVDTHSEAA
jgi:hypothetical protein